MKRIVLLGISILLGACATPPPEYDPTTDLGLLWVKHAAEYDAITRQVYAAATRALPELIDDHAFSAMPEQRNAESLPPAVILDVDETVVSNVDFQLSFERPFANRKLERWTGDTKATPVQGVRAFVDEARRLGAEVFFVTNRPCRAVAGIANGCPQRQTTIQDIREAGIETDAAHVLLSEERGWTREKLTRRLFVAETHRVVMLIGDDYGDFIPCVRDEPKAPCTEAATAESRDAALDAYDHYWGNGWYILPNPMHGSWTSFF